MRAYRLNDRAWTRIVTQRVRRPNLITARLRSRRRRDLPIPVDGQLVLLDGRLRHDPRSGVLLDRRELLDRLVEGLSIDGVDGVVAPADVLEELTVLNVLDHRLAVCDRGDGSSPAPADVGAAGFDAAAIRSTSEISDSVAAEIGALHRCGLPVLVDLRIDAAEATAEYAVEVGEWSELLRSATSSVLTGPGVWCALPAVTGFDALAELAGFPLLVRDTEVPIDPEVWTAWFGRELPITVRGIVAGASALFPMEVSVAEATETIATAVRSQVA